MSPSGPPPPKRPLDIDATLRLVSEAVQPYPKAAMFELAERGFASPFQQLVACLISVRTLDEVSLPAAIRLFTRAGTAQALSHLPAAEIDKLIHPASFHERKAEQILAIARRVADEFGGELPCDREVFLSFSGIGPKCANLALGVACGEPYISVDVHVHRITNRWGYVQAATPEATMKALEARLPRRYWVEINKLLVPFGKHVCAGNRPRCSACPILDMCQQVGVGAHR
jgi:endonuclease III